MDRPSFEKLVQNSLRRMPRRFKSKLKNISIEIEDNPSREILQDMGIERGILFGLYQGVPLTVREWNYGNVLPDRLLSTSDRLSKLRHRLLRSKRSSSKP